MLHEKIYPPPDGGDTFHAFGAQGRLERRLQPVLQVSKQTVFQWAWKQSGSQVIIIVDAPGLEEDIRHPHKSPPSGVCVSVVRDTTAHLSGQDRKTHIVHRYTRGPSHGGHPQSTLPCRKLARF